MLGKLGTTSKDGPWIWSPLHTKLTKTLAFHTKSCCVIWKQQSLHTGSFSKLPLNFPHFFLSTSPGSSGNSAPKSVNAALCCPEAKTPASSKETELCQQRRCQQRRWPGSPSLSPAVPEETTPLSSAEPGLQGTCLPVVNMESATHAYLTGHWAQWPLLPELLSLLNWKFKLRWRQYPITFSKNRQRTINWKPYGMK